MQFPVSLPSRKLTSQLRIAGGMLAIVPLLLMMAAVAPANGQTSTPASSPGDWTQFLRDNMQRWNPYETTIGVNNVGKLSLKWNAILGTVTYLPPSSPAVVNGVIYFGSGDDNVYALNVTTGAKLWSYTTGASVDSSPAVANGVVYVGSVDGNLYALNASTGERLWNFPTGAGIGGVSSSPAVVNGVVYFGSADGNIYALAASSGEKLWSYKTNFPVSGSPAVVNGTVYIGSQDSTVYALNASTGAKLWSYTTGLPIEGSAAVANGVVFIGSLDRNLYALNAATGAKLWSYQTGYSIETTPAVANGIVYVFSRDDTLYALNASTGTKLWSYKTGVEFASSPAVANGIVYFASDTGTIRAFNANTGAVLWTFASGHYGFTSPIVVNGVVYFGAGTDAGASMYAFGLGSADLFLRIQPSSTTVHQGDLLTYSFPVWNLGPSNADHEVLNTQVPAGTTFDYVTISGTPGLGTFTTPAYGSTGSIVCHENGSMAPNTTWTVRLTVKVMAGARTTITENAATMADTPDPNTANNMATVSTTVQ